MFIQRGLVLVGTLLLFGCLGMPAAAQDEDFDAHLFVVQDYLGTDFILRGVDGDGNGMPEEDQLGLLRTILAGGSPVSGISSTTVAQIRAGFTSNLAAVESELIVNVGSQGTVNLISQLADVDPTLGNAMQKLLAGIMTIADTSTVTYVNNLADQVIVKVLTGTPESSSIANVQAQINFTNSAFATFGNAPTETNFLGPDGDIDGDTETNLAEYTTAGENREAWLTSNGIAPPLRFNLLEGGGLKLSGLSVTFRMSAVGGAGPATYQWRKGTPGGSSALVADGSEFVIPFGNPSDDGKYFCSYADGAVTRTTPVLNLKVTKVPLFISRQIQGGSRTAGQSITFTVAAQGGGPGPYAYTWKRDGVTVGPNSPVFALTNLGLADAGNYTVSVTTNGGADAKISGPVTLSIVSGLPALSITKQPVNAVVGVGASHTFRTTVIGGSGAYNFDWRRDTVSLGAPDQPTLLLTDIQNADVGTYSCLISDQQDAGLNILTNNATLSITENPITIETDPEDARKALGQNVLFIVSASGASGSYNYEWLKDGLPINGALNQATYIVVNIDVTDAADYSCRVSDQADPIIQAESNPATLTVLPIDNLTIALQPMSVVKELGQFHTFTIQAQGGTGAYNYDWQKGGVSLGAANLPGYTIGSVTPASIGTYRCVVTDKVETFLTATTNDATLSVNLENLTILTQPLGGSRALGESIDFTVEVAGGSTNFSYDWRKDDVSIGAPSSPTLSIPIVALADAGSYTCVITDIGLSEMLTSDAAVLTVVNAPPIAIDTQPDGLTGYSGQTFDLTVAVSGGTGEFVYDWRKDGAPLCECNFPSLSFASLTPGDSGSYQVIVRDATFPELELASDEVILEIADHMNFTTQPLGANVFAGQTLQFAVGLDGGLPPVTFKWLKNGAPIPGAPATPSYLIGPARIASEGFYSLEVTDRFETVTSFSAAINVQLAELPADAQTFILSMDGSKAVPANASAATGVGSGSLTPQPGGGALLSVLLNHGVSSPTRFALHAGAPNVNGPVVVNFMQTGFNINTSVLLNDEEASMVYTGLAYLNISSLPYPSGEIRTTPFETIEFEGPHAGDIDKDGAFSLSELLRVIQLFNAEGYQCGVSEDGFALGEGLKTCVPHSSDYAPQDWVISLTELLRLIQFFNSPGRAYHPCDSSEDGYCIGIELP